MIRQGFPNGTFHYARGADSDTEVSILNQTFRLDPKATQPYYQFDMNPQDLKDILAAVREGKLRSDFMTVAIHAHHFHDAKGGERGLGVPETIDLDTNPSIANYLPVFAKAAIDNGADAFLGTGVHVLRGIEIYKGRPIFYGLGEFFRQMDVVGLSGMGSIGRGDENSPPIKYEIDHRGQPVRAGTARRDQAVSDHADGEGADRAARVAATRDAGNRAAHPRALAEAVHAARHDHHHRKQHRRHPAGADDVEQQQQQQ